MGFASRYQALIASHRSVEEKIESEMKRPMPDSLILQRLKRRKLLLKDEIESWERLMGAVGASEDGRVSASYSLAPANRRATAASHLGERDGPGRYSARIN